MLKRVEHWTGPFHEHSDLNPSLAEYVTKVLSASSLRYPCLISSKRRWHLIVDIYVIHGLPATVAPESTCISLSSLYILLLPVFRFARFLWESTAKAM